MKKNKKIIKNFFLIMFFLLVCLLPISRAKALETCDFEENIKMQIYVPGITEKCLEDVITSGVTGGGQAQTETVERYYVSADLTQYIKKVYNFAVGLIAIIAVIMIMVGGLQWTFAAGNPGKIDNAKTTITSAVAGLVLVMSSYLILDLINPKLTNLSLTQPAELIGYEVTKSNWCTKKPQTSEDGVSATIVFYEKGHFGETSYVKGTDATNLPCGAAFDYGYYENPNAGGLAVNLNNTFVDPNNLKYKGECLGIKCGSDQVCFGEYEYSFCEEPTDYCNATDKNSCEEINDFVKESENASAKAKSCAKAIKDFNPLKELDFGTDSCVWDSIIYCPAGWKRVNCLDVNSPAGACWTVDADGKKIPNSAISSYQNNTKYYCSDSEYANAAASSICCSKFDPSTGKKKYVLIGGPGANQYATIDCSQIHDLSQYPSEDAREKDHCNVGP